MFSWRQVSRWLGAFHNHARDFITDGPVVVRGAWAFAWQIFRRDYPEKKRFLVGGKLSKRVLMSVGDAYHLRNQSWNVTSDAVSLPPATQEFFQWWSKKGQLRKMIIPGPWLITKGFSHPTTTTPTTLYNSSHDSMWQIAWLSRWPISP